MEIHIYTLKESEVDFPEDSVELITRDFSAKTRAYKVTIKREDKDRLMDGAFWPSSVFVRKYNRPRQAAGGVFENKSDGGTTVGTTASESMDTITNGS